MQHELDATDQEHIYVLKDLDHKVKMNCLKRESFDMCMYEMHFFAHWPAFLFRPRVFFRYAIPGLRGSQGARAYIRRNFGTRPGAVARDLGVGSHAK